MLPSLLVLFALVVPQAAGASPWVPSQTSTFQWQLTVPVDQSVDAQVYDIDGFTNEASVVSSLHAQGRHVICYVDAGTWEEFRPDAGEFPESVLGKPVTGFPNERWLDISQLSVIEPIMLARMEMCKQKGFDAIEADNVEGYELDTGFELTAAEQLTYNEWLANTAHSLGLSIALKNDREQAAELEPFFDFAIDEECFQAEECGKLDPFTKAHKPVFEVEYELEPSQFCAQANAAGYMAIRKNPPLEAWNSPCWAQGNWVGAKGADGYDLAAFNGSSDLTDIPGVTVTLAKGSRQTWATNTTDTRALQSPDGSSRTAAAYSDPSEVQVELHFSKAYQGNLHLYAVDWDSATRRETITVGEQTASLTEGNFSQGAWASFPINVAAGETIPINVVRTAGASAVLSGIMLGDAPPPGPTITTEPEGSWVNAFGSGGYDLADWDGSGDVSDMPGASLSLLQGSRYQWAANTTDKRALQSPDGLTRNAATYYDASEIKLQMSFPAAYTGNLHLYAVDWDSHERRETITVNGQTAELSSDFSGGAWVSFPISVEAEGTVTITVDRTAGSNAVLSGVFLGDAGPPPIPTVASTPQGSWVHAVGSAGYDLASWGGAAGDISYLPDATLTLEQGSRYQWASNTTDPRALSDPGEQTRNAGTYYDPNEIQLKLNFTAEYKGDLHLYAVDWDSQGRRESISVGAQTAVLSSDFSQGAWVSFPISVATGGTITITVSRLAGSNAVLSGIFLGDAGAPPAPTVTSAPQGAWTKSVGSAGYDLASWNNSSGDVSDLPNASLSLVQGSRWQWAAGSTDPRALTDPGAATSNIGTYYDPNEIQLKMTFPAGYKGNLHLYAVDWDSQGRREIISADGQSVDLSSDFSEGAWVSFPINVEAGGTVAITVDRIAGSNAVLSGIFLGEGGTPPAPTVTSAPQGNWVGAFGSAGYDLAGWEGETDLTAFSNASLTVEQASRYTWAGSTTDPRALESPDTTTRVASTYYDPNEIKLKLSFPTGYKGELHLYALDWDSQGRRETISVGGQTAVLSNEFVGGAWASFPINVEAGGTVSITVTRLAGSNAVLSGIFLG